MADDAYTFANTRTRLEDIVSQVRKKDTSLEKSLDLLEEGVRLANQCTELIDHADWAAGDAPVAASADPITDGSAPDDTDEVEEVAVDETAETDSDAAAASAGDDAEGEGDAEDEGDGEDDA